MDLRRERERDFRDSIRMLQGDADVARERPARQTVSVLSGPKKNS